jgi:hypothetical protein
MGDTRITWHKSTLWDDQWIGGVNDISRFRIERHPDRTRPWWLYTTLPIAVGGVGDATRAEAEARAEREFAAFVESLGATLGPAS